MSARSGIGYDSHRFVAGRPLILAGVEVPDAAMGLGGHSDADVATHAIVDALLGAAGLGDIGLHYPDTDERWRDADSIELLVDVATLLRERGWDLGHLDVKIVCEAPRLGAYRESMRDRLAAAAGLGPSDVNVGFSTNEGMGFVGRGEGIAAMACATVERA